MTITTETHSRIPGHDATKAAHASLGPFSLSAGVPVIRHTPTEPAAHAEVQARITELLSAGEPIPDDIAAPIIAAQRHDLEQLTRVRAVDEATRDLFAAAQVTEETVIPALDYLRTELARVVTEGTTHAAALNGAHTAAQVVNAGAEKVKAWQAMTALVDDYNEIRTNQRRLYSSTVEGFTAALFDQVGTYADAIDVHPYWIERRTLSAQSVNENNRDVARYAEWLGNAHNQSPSFDVDLEPQARLALVITTTLPWVPTPEQFTVANQLLNEATGVPRTRDVDHREDKRAELYALTGATPVGDAQKSDRVTSIRSGGTTKKAAVRRIQERIGTQTEYDNINGTTNGTQSVPVGGY